LFQAEFDEEEEFVIAHVLDSLGTGQEVVLPLADLYHCSAKKITSKYDECKKTAQKVHDQQKEKLEETGFELV
jgi:dTDP-4-dehydrorhamnose reductase